MVISRTRFLSSLMLASLLALSSTPANSLTGDKVEPLGKTIDSIEIERCYLNAESTFDFCSPAVVEKLKVLTKAKPNFGPKKQSVLSRFWSPDDFGWVYVGINTKTKKVFLYDRIISTVDVETQSAVPESVARKVALTFGKSDKICSSGVGVAFDGSSETGSYIDYDKDIDYCVDYDDDEGFGLLNQVDSKTRKLLDNYGV